MVEILNTNFVHDNELHEASIASDAPYTIYEPIAERVRSDGSVEMLSSEETLADMKTYVENELKVKPGHIVPLGGITSHSVGEIIDTDAKAFLEEVNGVSPVPAAFIGFLKTTAQLAERSGFDREKSRFRATIMQDALEGNPNLNIHADGLGGLVNKDTQTAKMTRFVYPMRPGTVIYPDIQNDGKPVDVTYKGNGIAFIDNPTEIDLIGQPRSAEFTQQELLDGRAQQVLPGRILGFDPTRRFWHQAPDQNGAILVIDITESS